MEFYPLAAALISAAFAFSLLTRYRARRRPYLLAWGVALSVYAAAALTEVWGAVASWNPALFRAYYFLGGILLVGLLALGTVCLLAPRWARLALTLLALLGAVGLAGAAGAHVRAIALQTHQVPPLSALPAEGGIFNVLAIAMAALINIAGTIVLVGGALWSAYSVWRRGGLRQRLYANLLIAAGALIVASASSLTRLGVYALFYVGQAVGVLVMFAGFLEAQREPSPAKQTLRPVTPAGAPK
jgi:hypothetical protein